MKRGRKNGRVETGQLRKEMKVLPVEPDDKPGDELIVNDGGDKQFSSLVKSVEGPCW